MNTFFSTGNKRSYNDFRNNVSPQIQSLFDSLRDFCLSLGSNVIEDVRMHRVVFCKSLSFRWFADLEPSQDEIIIKIQKSRKDPQRTVRIKPYENLDKLKEFLREAFNTIH